MSFRSKNNEPISCDEWNIEKQNSPLVSTAIQYNDLTVTICKQYYGNIGAVFKVWIEAEPSTKFYNYIARFDGDSFADADYQRLITAVTNNDSVFPQTVMNGSGQIILKFDASNNKHLVIDRSGYPSIAYAYDYREDAESFFNELAGN